MNFNILNTSWDSTNETVEWGINHKLYETLIDNDLDQSKKLFDIIQNFSLNWEMLGKFLSQYTWEQLESLLINPFKSMILNQIKNQLSQVVLLDNPDKIQWLDIVISHIDYVFLFELSSIRNSWKPRINSKNILKWFFTIPNDNDIRKFMSFPFEFNLDNLTVSIFDENTNISIIKRILKNNLN